jgi:hypothetical protein
MNADERGPVASKRSEDGFDGRKKAPNAQRGKAATNNDNHGWTRMDTDLIPMGVKMIRYPCESV